LAIFEKWDLNCVEIGNVTENGQLRYFWNGEIVAELPAAELVLGGGAPVYEREYIEPADFVTRANWSHKNIAEDTNYKENANKHREAKK
jgi:phosphoribosylformylglycinamidine synthase